MLIGAHLAGAAIEASMLGASHACANPLTARYQVVHGVAVGLMLPHVIRFNAEAVDEHYRRARARRRRGLGQPGRAPSLRGRPARASAGMQRTERLVTRASGPTGDPRVDRELQPAAGRR